MLSYALRKLIQIPITLFGVVVIVFALIHLAPGDPIATLVGDTPASPQYIAELRTYLGLDQAIARPVRPVSGPCRPGRLWDVLLLLDLRHGAHPRSLAGDAPSHGGRARVSDPDRCGPWCDLGRPPELARGRWP